MDKTIIRSFLLLAVLFFSQQLAAQTVRGVVTDETDLPMPGASVVVQDLPGVGTTTDFNGEYVLENLKPGNHVLEISFVGYQTKDIKISLSATSNITVDVKMEVANDNLDEAVVVGYAVQRKRDVTGSIVKLDGKELTDMPTPSFEAAIQGKAPGVQIITGSGLSGSPSVVRIRGIASITAAGDPLYVVDGIPITQDYFINGNSGAMNNNPLAALNPNDIESIEILKDASATAIYGSRGSNGVIIITTKRGKKGGLQFNFNSSFGISQPTKKPQMLSGPEYLAVYEEAWINDGNVGTPSGLPGGLSWEEAQKNNTDWIDATIGTGFKQFYDFSAQKGTKNYNFYLGGSFDDNESYLLNNSYQRMTLRANGDFRISDKFKIGLTSSISRGDNERVDAAWSGGLGAAMSTALPIYPIYWDRYNVNADGDTLNRPGDYWLQAGVQNNPVAFQQAKEWRTREYRFLGGINLNYAVSDNWKFNMTGSYDRLFQIEDVFVRKELHNIDTISNGIAIRNPLSIDNYNVFATTSYDFKLNKKHKFILMGGVEYQESVKHLRSRKGTNPQGQPIIVNTYFGVDEPIYGRSLSEYDSTFVDPFSKFNFISAFTRLNYDYSGKYLFQFVFRTDGSSKFGPDKRFGFFPSASAGWIATEEKFLKHNPVINFLKFKLSYGLNGNANIPPFQWRSNYGVSNQGYAGRPIIYPTILPNPDLQWESSAVLDAGFEFGLWQDRITGEFSVYNKQTDGVFMQVALPRYNGLGAYTDNIGAIVNRGVEFQIRSRNFVKKFQWTTDFNISYNYNEITSLGGYSPEAVGGGTNDTRTVLGSPVGTNFLVQFSHVDPATGEPVYLDIDGNQTRTWDPANRVAVGGILPDAIGGITNTFRYGPFDLSTLIVFTIGGNIYDSSSKRQLGVVDDWNKTYHFADRWEQPGDNAKYPRATLDPANHGSATPWINTTLYLHDASYARLRNLTLGYNLPSSFLERAHITTARISLIGTNLLTFTKFPGVDPEIARDFENPTDRNLSPNITYLTPPQEKTYSISLNLTF